MSDRRQSSFTLGVCVVPIGAEVAHNLVQASPDIHRRWSHTSPLIIPSHVLHVTLGPVKCRASRPRRMPRPPRARRRCMCCHSMRCCPAASKRVCSGQGLRDRASSSWPLTWPKRPSQSQVSRTRARRISALRSHRRDQIGEPIKQIGIGYRSIRSDSRSSVWFK